MPSKGRADEITFSKSDMNSVVLDFLVNEGFPRAAQLFAKEANMKVLDEESYLQPRVNVMNTIHRGDIKAAIDLINDINPDILDRDPSLHFALLRLQLIELIRDSTEPDMDIMPAVYFAKNQLAPRGATNPEFRKDLEDVMTLVVLPRSDAMNQPHLKELLNLSHRRNIAARVNEAILINCGQQREARLRNLVRLRQWSERKLRASGKELPKEISRTDEQF
jgi:hypothetical protein